MAELITGLASIQATARVKSSIPAPAASGL